MASNANCGFFNLADEMFDFDVSMSPASSKGDEEEDEVFVGPIGHKERCINVGLETLAKASVSSGYSLGELSSWSPLSGERFEHIRKEAHQLANQLEVGHEHPDNAGSNGTAPESKEAKEDFVLDCGAKLGVFSKPVDAVLSPIKRETFCVQDSPMKKLPPAIQQRLLRANSAAGSRGEASSAKARVSTSSPVRGSKSQTQPKMALRGRAGLTGAGGVLPSKAAAPNGTTTSLSTRTRPVPAEKTTRLPPPSKVGNLASGRRSVASAGRSSSRAAPGEERLSDAASVGSDVSDSSLNSSLHGRRGLAPPNKRPPSVKASPYRRVADKRGSTSSSSSSVSSFNSSLSVSPTGKAKLNSSLNISARASTGVSRLANPGPAPKNRRSLLAGRAPEAAPPSRPSACVAGARRSVSVQGRGSAPGRPTPAKRSDEQNPAPPLLLQTPAKKRALERTTSVPNVSSSPSAHPEGAVKPRPKLTALVAPTPSGQLRGLRGSEAVASPGAPRIMKPKKLLPACSVDSLPQKPAASAPQLHTPSAGGPASLRPQMRRPSALPTPVKRRVSSIPTLTPKSAVRPGSSALCRAALPASVTRRDAPWSPAQGKTSRQPEAELQSHPLPFSLEDEPEQPPASAPQPDSQDPRSAVSQSPAEPSAEEPQEGPHATQENQDPRAGSEEPREDPHSTQENQDPRAGSEEPEEGPHPTQEPRAGPEEPEEGPHPTQENQDPRAGSEELQDRPQPTEMKTLEVIQVLLVDVPAPVLRPEERLLIDLSNTPLLVKTAKPSAGQLIDLSSPLIQWSPEDKKKNAVDDAPLINLSF